MQTWLMVATVLYIIEYVCLWLWLVSGYILNSNNFNLNYAMLVMQVYIKSKIIYIN